MPSPSTSSATNPVSPSGQLDIDALLYGVKWDGTAGQSLDITYSFPGTTPGVAYYVDPYSTRNEPYTSSMYALSAVEQGGATQAMQAWADVANITFTQVTESATDVGDIRIIKSDASNLLADGTQAWGWTYEPNSKNPSGGDVWISTLGPNTTASKDWSAGSYNYEAIMHELGHALGLKHPFDGSIVLDAAHDNRLYTLMAYDNAPNSLFVDVTHTSTGYSWRSYTVNPDTPMLYDIAAMQYLYGANMSYHAGDDTYTFDPSTPFLRTIWDGGGNDTISVANFSTDCVIDLREGHFSSIRIPSDTGAGINWTTPPPVGTYDGTNNLAIAYGAVIENAVGGSGNDTLIGNSGANRLQGNGGSNTLMGGDGIDTAVYTGNFSDYDVTPFSNASASGYTVQLRADSGQTDGLIDIERLAFKDATLAFNMNSLSDDPVQAQYVALVQEFYVAYFGRPADAVGLASMVAQFVAAKVPTSVGALAEAYDGNATVKTLIDSFSNSDESARLYHGTNVDFVTAIYAHVLGRAPDQGGLDFWSGALDDGAMVRGLAALDIMAGAQANTTPQGRIDAEVIANRITVAGNFTALFDTPSAMAGYAGDAAAAAARAMLDSVNQNTSIIAYESTVISVEGKMAAGVPAISLVGVVGHELVPA